MAITETKRKIRGAKKLKNYVTLSNYGVNQRKRTSNDGFVISKIKFNRGYITIISVDIPEEGRCVDIEIFNRELQQHITEATNHYILLICDI